jgi:hypothetical protein
MAVAALRGLDKTTLADVKKQLIWQGLARWRRA